MCKYSEPAAQTLARRLWAGAGGLAALLVCIGLLSGAPRFGAEADPRVLRAQMDLDIASMTAEDLARELAALDPIFARLQRDEPKRFVIYVGLLRDFTLANVSSLRSVDQLAELGLDFGGRLAARKAETVDDAMIEQFVELNVEFLWRMLEIDPRSCLGASEASSALSQLNEEDPELVYEVLRLNLLLLTDPATTRRPMMSEADLIMLVTGPFMTAVLERARGKIIAYRPAASQAAEIAALYAAFLTGAPPPSDKLWLDCFAEAAMLEEIAEIEPRKRRVAAMRLFISFAADPI